MRPSARVHDGVDVGAAQAGSSRSRSRCAARVDDDGDLFDLVRGEVGPNLRPFAQHLWEVRWDRRGGPPRISQTIPFPSVNLTVEAGTPGEVRHGHPLPAALLHGVVTRTFRIGLDGAGWACG